MTPPLPPNSGYSHYPISPRSVSPLSPAPTRNGKHNPDRWAVSEDTKHVPLSLSPAYIHIVTPSRTPSPISVPFTRHLSREPVNQSPFAAVPVRLPFLDKFEKVDGSDDDSDKEAHSPSTDSDAGLAYADDSDDDTLVVIPHHMYASQAHYLKQPSGNASTSSTTSYSSSQTANAGPSGAQRLACHSYDDAILWSIRTCDGNAD
ncbi:hypothetical protein K503DRAFT_800150 [Rhizopogon vinicolor AM-OR11-026]|uniref:Uncharacterized protein n=1 Tax=Rhizopogon vinicolor AM-OR11-026 TaxID=1314800 RepID=A0A1B7N1T3_9AGAM|nr:hypothetical protein K503DRAFT_800150 [Rhizopogon vinicolor AM-OR11-026]